MNLLYQSFGKNMSKLEVYTTYMEMELRQRSELHGYSNNQE